MPPILQWKVSLALLAVVLAGVTLGSVLHSAASSANSGYFCCTSYTPAPIPLSRMRQLIANPPHVHTFFVLAPEPETPLDRLRSWLDRTFYSDGR